MYIIFILVTQEEEKKQEKEEEARTSSYTLPLVKVTPTSIMGYINITIF